MGTRKRAKRQTMVNKRLYIKLSNTNATWGWTPEEYAVPDPLGTPIVLFLLSIRWLVMKRERRMRLLLRQSDHIYGRLLNKYFVVVNQDFNSEYIERLNRQHVQSIWESKELCLKNIKMLSIWCFSPKLYLSCLYISLKIYISLGKI
jgi:hypothetical protein